MVDHAFDPIAGTVSGQASTAEGGERVAKVLARAGVASRRDVEKLIAAGRVALNGQVLQTPAVKVGPHDILTVDGEAVGEAEPTRVWRYHKPTGLVTTHRDPKGRPTVFEHLPEDLPRVISVGRLDLNSEGLLLLTNDGALARSLEMPASGLVRRYRARARGTTTQAKLDTLKAGLTVEGVHYGPIEARLDKAKDGPAGANLWITVTLAEGKNREVRKVLEALGLIVNRLIRLSYGPFQLGTLEPGEVEEVGPRVIREQLAAYIDPAALPPPGRARRDGVMAGAATAADAAERPLSGPRRGRGVAANGRPAPAKPAAPAKPPAPRPEYKAGWAKPKKRVSHAPAKPSKASKASRAAAERRGQADTRSRPDAPAKPEARGRSEARAKPAPAGKPGPRAALDTRPPRSPGPGRARPTGARPPRGDGPKRRS